MDRGGLRWPTEFLVEIFTQVFIVFQCVVSSKYESKFLVLTNHKSIAFRLCVEHLSTLELFIGECVYGTLICNVVESAVATVVNILLNNYCKRATDRQSIAKSKSSQTQRKLSSLMKK